MKILSAAQLREANAFTIASENLGLGELMERAAMSFVNWFSGNCNREKETAIFCGPGNNGGDGLAIARLLYDQRFLVRAFLPENDSDLSDELKLNLERLPPNLPLVRYKEVSELDQYHLSTNRVVDALFGTGLNRPLLGLHAETIRYLNNLGSEIVSVDIPSGLYADLPTPEESPVIKAAHTVTFSAPKLALLLPQNQVYCGHFHTVLIGLNIPFFHALRSQYYFTTPQLVQEKWRPRPKFAHKGTFGHALMLAGSYGKIGAALLSTRACLRSGAGLVSSAVPEVGYHIMQTSAPEAMAIPAQSELHLAKLPENLNDFDAVGAGPGLGQHEDTRKLVAELLQKVTSPLVLDADALNILSADKTLLQKLPNDTILTPHPKEFERLTQPARNDFHLLEILQNFCEENRCYVVLKGAYTCTGTPAGDLFFNSTGNPGMATGGSGDVLTGMITALRAQGYPPEDACVIGVYMHGRAGDLAKETKGETALIASDIIEHLGAAFSELEIAG